MIYRELPGLEAALLVESWGYRPIWHSEVVHARWFTDDPQTAIVWFELAQKPGDLVLHGCAVPKLGRRALTREALDAIRCVARSLGGQRLFAPVPSWPAADSRVLLRYLRLHGFAPSDSPLGLCLDLGG